ncbi:TPA: hypothetical protein N0F65_002868 [Lagenidium giganteum]|uniref:HMA domain-containing protein n=1 Tax=Lagenidium giganteum TaxID=4803 RepID=A0AAV2ZBV4_9STRA|nr:TPA: hypothetical protein N0F65_002868 [Lagenidium giganteum]
MAKSKSVRAKKTIPTSPVYTPVAMQEVSMSEGIVDGVCVSEDEDVPSLTMSQRQIDDESVVFLTIPALESEEDGAKIVHALREMGGALHAQLDMHERLIRIEMPGPTDETVEAELAVVVRRVDPKLVAYPVWQHRDRIVKLKIDGMRCMTNCGRQVIQALEKIPGVLHIHVDSQSKTAEIAMGKGCTATEVDLIRCIRAANSRFDAFVAKEGPREPSVSTPGAVLLTIEGMSCAKNCARKVQAALHDADGVIDATVDFNNKRATVLLEPESKLTEADLIELVRKAGAKFNASLYVPEINSRTVVLTISGMSCAKNCARKVQNALSEASGVVSANVDFANKVATVELEPGSRLNESDLIDIVKSAGVKFNASLYQPPSSPRAVQLKIDGMSCAKNCARKVQTALNEINDVVEAVVDFPSKVATIQLKPGSHLKDSDLIDTVRRAGAKFNASVYQPKPRIVRLEIGGMSCAANCARKVKEALSATTGVENATVDFPSKIATIELSGTSTLQEKDLIDVVKKAGTKFSATVANGSSKAVNGAAPAPQAPKDSKTRQPVAGEEKPSQDVVVNIRPAKEDVGDISLLLGGMTCNSCANSIENALKQTPGVTSAVVNFATEKANVRFNKEVVGIRTLVETVEAIGYEASFVTGSEAQQALGDQRSKEITRYRNDFFVSVLFTFPIMLIMMVFGSIPAINDGLMTNVLPGMTWMSFIVAILTTPVQFYSARRFHIDAWKGMKHNVLGMPFLISMGSNASYFYGLFSVVRGLVLCDSSVAYPDMFMTASMLIAFVILGKYLEAIAKGKTSEALSKLLELQAKSATLLLFNSAGTAIIEEKVVPIELVQRGDILKVVRGGSVPADGVVVYGEGRLDESMLTGESKTIKKTTGDKVLGATVNVDGLFHMKVTGVDNDTMLSQIIRLVEDAQTSKAPIQAYADYVASVFVPTVLVISGITFVTWYVLCLTKVVPQSWIPTVDSDFVFAFNFAIAALVVACPCALGLATPTAVMVGTGVGAEHGVLIKGGEPLEVAHSVDTILFDKTGTLTVGQPVVTDVVVLSKKLSTEELIFLAGSAELGSEHPLSKAIIDYAKFLSKSLEQPTDFRGVSGRGISCFVGEKRIVIGNREWMEDNGLKRHDSIVLHQATVTFQNAGKTSVYVGVDNELCAVFGVADAPRPEAIRTLQKLRKMGLDVWMVTGDNKRTAFTIADQLGINRKNVMAEVVPSEKSNKVKTLQSQGRVVAMVGDGINDSPALAQANLGIAIGAGTEIAVETAGMVLMKSNLCDVITALDLSRTIFNRIRLNFFWALGYNILLIPLAAGALYPLGFSIPPMFAGGAMALSSVSVVTSSLLLRYYTPPEIPVVYADDNKSVLFKKPTVTTPLLASSSLE